MSDLLSPELLANIGRSSQPRQELVARREIRKYAIATSPVPFSFPLQIFAYFCADIQGLSPDKPRNLAKSVTVK